MLGKGSKTRVLPVGRKALAALASWFKERSALLKHETTAVFITAAGRRLGARAIQKRVAYWGGAPGPADGGASAPVPALVRLASS